MKIESKKGKADVLLVSLETPCSKFKQVGCEWCSHKRWRNSHRCLDQRNSEARSRKNQAVGKKKSGNTTGLKLTVSDVKKHFMMLLMLELQDLNLNLKAKTAYKAITNFKV